MSSISPEETKELVGLLRSLSQETIRVTRPALRPDLESRSHSLLPRRPQAVLFDVYGTLVVSAAGGEPNLVGPGTGRGGTDALACLEAELAMADYSGPAALFHNELMRVIYRQRDNELVRTPHPEIVIEEILAQLLPSLSENRLRRLAVAHEAWCNPCAAMPGSVELLRTLAASVRLGLVSNAQFYTPLLMEALWYSTLEELGLERSLCVFSCELKVAKPDPAPFLKAESVLREGGISPEQSLVVGNSSANDIAPAKELGFMTALFAGDSRSFRPSPIGSQGEPDIVLVSLEELPLRWPSDRS